MSLYADKWLHQSDSGIPVAGMHSARQTGVFFQNTFPSTSSASFMVTFPSVIVPVLSEQRIFMLPKFSMDDNRFTITFFFAIARAPVDRLTVMIAGSSCGVRPNGKSKRK